MARLKYSGDPNTQKRLNLCRKLGNMASMAYKKLEENETRKLQNAVQRFVENLGGKLVVIGGAELWHWPTDSTYNFHIAMKCTGAEPPFVKKRQGMK